MIARTDAPSFLPALTGVRAFAAFWVVALHLTVVVAALIPGVVADAIVTVSLPGALGVDVFFVLSGFIISHNYDRIFAGGVRAIDHGRFLWARLARIYPVHLVTLCALVVAVKLAHVQLGGAAGDDRWSTRTLVECLLLIQAWVGDADAWNAVSWSISAEWFAYLAFPLLAGFARASWRRLGEPTIWIVIVALAAIPAVHWTIAAHLTYLPSLPPLQIAAEFTAGCLAYQVFAGGGGRRVPDPTWLLVAIVAGASALRWVGAAPFWVVPLVPPMLVGLAHDRGPLARGLARPVAIYWGKVSFALYMTHYLWLWVMHYFVPLATWSTRGLAIRIALVVAHLVPMLVVAALTFHLIEEPARRYLARRVRKPAA